LLRVLTPLLKFRACRDARKVAGDAMEVRGGCGYIEEFSDARILRDAHLGSIWEGTSNIVALDVMRSIRREDTLAVLDRHVGRQLAEARLPAALQAGFENAWLRVRELATAASASGRESLARQAASALYHAVSASTMAWEARKTGDARRLLLAQMVLRHRLLPRDPLSAEDEELAGLPRLLSEEPIAGEQA
jgi:hypothetical protein